MKPSEIRMFYRDAKNKRQAIRYLADMNVCGIEDILELIPEASALFDKKQNSTKITSNIINNYEREFRDLFLDGKTDREVAEYFEISVSMVEYIRNKLGIISSRGKKKAWTESKKEQLRHYFRRGLSDREIAEVMESTVTMVKRQRLALGLLR